MRQLGGMWESRSNEQTDTGLFHSKSPLLSHYRCNGYVTDVMDM